MADKKRVYLLDVLRGAAVIAMIVHHSYVLLNFTRGVTLAFFSSTLFDVLQIFFVSIFLLVSGICSNYSRNIAKRGVIVFGAALIVTLVTAVLLPQFGFTGLEIKFGILHMFGLSMLLYACLRPILEKCNTVVTIVISIALFVAYNIWTSYIPFVESPYNVLMIFGFPSRSFYSSDYYPLLPYFFLFVAGGALGRLVKAGKMPRWFFTVRVPFLEFVGRHSLLIYLLHQPIVFALIMLIGGLVDIL